MSGPTISMAPAVESTDNDMFHRSHSSPDLITLGSLPSNAHPPNNSDNQPLTRSTHIFDNIRHTVGSPGSQSSHTLSPLPAPPLASSPSSSSFPSSPTPPPPPSLPSSSTPKAAASGAAGPAKLVSAFSAPNLVNTPHSSSPLKTSSASSASRSSLTSKELPSLPAFDVPSFDFDGDLDSELEFSLLRKRKPNKPVDPPTPRRVWEEFIKKDDVNTTNKENETSPSTSEFGAELEARFQPPTSTSGGSDTNPTRSRFDFPSANDSKSVTKAACMQQRPSTAVAPSTKQQALDKEQELASSSSEKPARRRTIVERPLSWIPSSRSAPDFHDLLVKEREKEARKAKQATGTPPSKHSKTSSLFQRTTKDEKIASAARIATSSEPTTLQVDGDRMGERQKTVSASFVDFAKRSWISRSPSPSSSPSRKPPTKKERDEEKKKEKERAKEREKEVKEKERGRGRDESSRSGPRLSRRRTVSTIFGGSGSGPAGNDDEPTVSSATAAETDKSIASASQHSGSLNGDVSTTTVNGDGGTGPIGAPEKAQSANVNGATAPEPISIVVVPPASTSRTFGRASEYLSRMKQRPQSMFVKAVANSTSTKLSNSNDDLSDELHLFDDEGNGRTSTSSSLSLSLELLSDKRLKPSRSAGRKLGEISGSNSSANSDDGSSDGSASGSALLPASEAESLTTADTSNNSPMAHPNSRDPHWVAFKDLETNFFKFLSKTTTAERMIIVRATLAPFLRRFANDNSNKNNSLLSPEDIERRASILNRWWTGLLEMLDAPSQFQGGSSLSQSGGLFGTSTFFGTSTTVNGTFTPVSGIDRPVVLESVSMIMSRPEWRLLTDVYRPLNDRSVDENSRAGASATGVSPVDESSIFVEESAEHNVRTMFVNNLLAQLILVVDKMSIRQAPLSIVNFSGKACAYAFFFVPGVADILVRLWGLEKNTELLRRAADAFGLPRRSRTRAASDELAANFPPCIGPLGWSSVISMQANLRKPPRMSQLPPAYVSACSRVTWFAPCWLSRWRGADTDLLFVFTKYYHILASEFMPSSLKLSLTEKARAPGFVLLHAQLLHIFDNTIHRQAAVEAAMLMAGAPVGDGTPSLWTQQQLHQKQPYVMPAPDDTPGGSPMAIQPTYNLFRDMDENRIIALLRDFLESDESVAGARDTFAETAMVLLKAATFRTSQYDHNACYILCDFLQEILLTFDNYYGYRDANEHANDNSGAASQPVDYIDWTFWLDVYKMMLNSNNTMSEIRVLSFIFATWDIVTADPQRKEELCVHWLLSEEVFGKFFNNWCPMVRAYYMRLLCWRVCRDSGTPNEFDARIFLLVSQRLKTVWSHFLWLKQKAENEGILQPSTAPSLPQPGKRFMIVRTEVNNGSQLGLLANTNNGGSGSFGSNNRTATTFDALSSTVGGISPNLGSSGSDTSSISSRSSIDDKKESGSKKKWSLFSKVLNLGTKAPTDEEFEQMRRDTAMARTTASKAGGPAPPAKPLRLGSSSSDSGSSTGSAPVFDASQFVFKFMLHNIPWQGVGGQGQGAGQGAGQGQGDIVLPPAYRERVLGKPRLPAPAQSCVTARISASGKRTESPPPPAAGLPPITRRISGLAAGGLVDDARNANPTESVPCDDASSGAVSRSDSVSSSRPSLGYQRGSGSPFGNSGEWDRSRNPSPLPRNSSVGDDFELERERERVVVQAVEPQDGDAKLRAKYAGRALAEWSLVVSECNSFVERRRDEGVYGLKDVEVPTLGVEGMRRLG